MKVVNRDVINVLIGHYSDVSVDSWMWSQCFVGVLREEGILKTDETYEFADLMGVTMAEADDMIFMSAEGSWREFGGIEDPKVRGKFIVDALVRLRDTGKFSWRASA